MSEIDWGKIPEKKEETDNGKTMLLLFLMDDTLRLVKLIWGQTQLE